MKVKLLLIAILAFVLKTNAQWTHTNGPEGGNIRTVAAIGTDLFAGIYYQGAYKSSNNGTSWTKINSVLTGNINVFAFAGSGGNMFAATNAGMYKSVNSGNAWFAINNGLPTGNYLSLMINGTNLFAGSNRGVYSSANNGNTWNIINNGLTDTIVYALTSLGANIYAGTIKGIFVSANNGNSWTKFNNVLSNATIYSLMTNGSSLYAATQGGVYMSIDSGLTWNLSANSGYTTSLTAVGNEIYAGTLGNGVFFTNNNGNTWSQINNGLNNKDIFSIALKDSNIFVGTRGGGVFFSPKNATSWNTVNTGIIKTDVTSLKSIGVTLFAGVYGGGVFTSTNNGTTWTDVNNGLSNLFVTSLAVIGTTLFAGTNGDGVFVSFNNGGNWFATNVTGFTNNNVTSLAVVGTNIIAGTGGGLFKSNNNGVSWTSIHNGLTTLQIVSLASSNGYIFAGTYDGVFLSLNLGGVWTACNNGLPIGIGSYMVTAEGPNIFTANGNLVYSLNSTGTYWNPVNNTVFNFTIIKSIFTKGTKLLAGSYNGLFMSQNSGNSWSNLGLPTSSLHDAVNTFFVDGSNFFAGTLASGVYLNTNVFTAITENSYSSSSINVYPNPLVEGSTLTLTTNTHLSSPQITIFNTLGETIYSEKINTPSNTFTKQIKLDAPPGVYIIKLTDSQNQYTSKLIIQ